jgi:DNA-binding NarL/FixJ family response regulator
MNAQASAVLVSAAPAVPHMAAALVRGGVDLVGSSDAAGALPLVEEHRPQVVVVELDGGTEMLDTVAELAVAVPQVPLLTLSTDLDHAVALAAVRAGATSHLAGPVAPPELAGAVRRTAAGEVVFSPGLADVLLEEFGRPAAERGPRQLTERESDVVRLVVEGLTARQIATRLVLSPRTVENHVQHVLRKLHLRSRAALVRYAIEHGLA